MIALDAAPIVPDRVTITAQLTGPDEMFGLPAAAAPDAYVTGAPAVAAAT